MKPALLITCILLIAIFSLSMVGYADSSDDHYVHFTKMTIDFEGTDAMVTMSYDLNTFSRLYVLLLGSHNLNPTLEETLFDFDDIKVLRIGRNQASVYVENISRQNEEYFLHDSHLLGAKVDVLTMVYPDGSTRSVPGATSTPDTFYLEV
jgi:hypothetical protein